MKFGATIIIPLLRQDGIWLEHSVIVGGRPVFSKHQDWNVGAQAVTAPANLRSEGFNLHHYRDHDGDDSHYKVLQ